MGMFFVQTPALGRALEALLSMLDLMDAAYTLCVALTTLRQRAKYLPLVSLLFGPLVLRVYNRIHGDCTAVVSLLTGIQPVPFKVEPFPQQQKVLYHSYIHCAHKPSILLYSHRPQNLITVS